MKEFVTKRGGRHLFNEDFDNLQDTILAIASFFKDCGLNFIISGCEEDGDYINGGFVFLDGKIRKVERTDVSNIEPPYCICAYDVEYRRDYKKGNNDVVGVDYKTEIVSGVDEPEVPYIYIDYDNFGSDEFPSVEMFWNHYAVTKNYGSQTVDNINANSSVRAKKLIFEGNNGNIEASIKDDGTFVCKYMKPLETHRVEIAPTGLPISFYAGDTLSYQIGTTEGLIAIILATAHAINCDTVDASQYLLNNVDINDLYFTQLEYADTGWLNILDVSDANNPVQVSNLFARQIFDIVYIQGTLPADFFVGVTRKNQFTLNTKYKLPAGISLPGDEGETFKFNWDLCHLHTIALISQDRAYNSGINANHTIGCDVRINSDGKFSIVQGKQNGRADGLYDNSLPTFPSGVIFSTLAFDENARPNVAWQYAVNTGITIDYVRYVNGALAMYNPAPGYVVDGQTYSGYVIHEYCYRQKYVTGSNGTERLDKTWHFNVVKIEYRIYHDEYSYSQNWRVKYINKVYDSPDWVNYPSINYVADYIDYKYYTGTAQTEWEMRPSSGIYFRNPDPTKNCMVRVTWKNNELGMTISRELDFGSVMKEPECLICEIHGVESTSPAQNGKYTVNGLDCYVYERYYYEAETGYRTGRVTYSVGQRVGDSTIEIIEGNNYVEFDGARLENGHQHLRFTAAGLAMTTKFTVTILATMHYKGMPDNLLSKTDTIVIDPTKFNLSNG